MTVKTDVDMKTLDTVKNNSLPSHWKKVGTNYNPPIVQTEQDNPLSVSEVLNQRGTRYGKFKDHAEITQYLKRSLGEYKYKLEDDQVEALEMIFHKIGRILNGDPNYDDSWIDIAGYAQLIADRLQGKAR